LDGERLLPAPLISEIHAPHVYIASQSPYSEFDGGTASASNAPAAAASGWSGMVEAGPQMTLVPDFASALPSPQRQRPMPPT
jgi:hypothetical protein